MPILEEPTWLILSVYLVAGFVLLAKGADWLVGGSSGLARRIGVSTLAIGLTVVAWGTSAPEVVVSSLAAYQGQSAISLGNVLGSNVANIGLVLGACAIVLPGVLEQRLRAREMSWLFASLIALWVACADGSLVREEAALLLGLFVIYNAILFITARREPTPKYEQLDTSSTGKDLGLTLLGMVGVVLGAKLVVMGAEGGALRLGVDQRVVGLTVVAVGTSLPELAAGLGGAFKGETDISIGNVVGSNVFNVLAVLGIVGLVRPLDEASMPTPEAVTELNAAFAGALSKDFYIVLGFSLAAVMLPYLGGARGGRLKGFALLLAYGIYSASLFVE